MHFLLVFLRLVLDRLIPGWRDGLSMAGRADGKIEHLPTGPSLWDRWLSFTGQKAPRGSRKRGRVHCGRGIARPRE
jgi:hypothetical protein